MFIFAGSYERFIFGFSASADCSEPQDVVKRYTFAAHKSGVKCMVASGPFVASGGSDDLIHLYDMKGERDLGVLMNPGEGAVPCLEFYTPEGRSTPSHMLSGSADGGIHIWRCKEWQHLKVMLGHKGAVNSLAVHHSGKLALSVARDRAIRMWNLTNGRVTYVAPLEAEAEEVTFLRSGDSYLLLAGNKITVHSTSGEGGLLATYTAPRRILCTAAQSDKLLLLGLEDGSVRLWDVRTSGVVGGWERAHTSRVRGMAIMKEGPGDLPDSLVTASSDGTIKLWDTRRMGAGGDAAAGAGAGGPGARCTAQVSTGARLTCLAAVDPAAVAPVRSGPPAAAAAAVGAAAEQGGKLAKKAKKAAAADAAREEGEGDRRKPLKAPQAGGKQQAPKAAGQAPRQAGPPKQQQQQHQQKQSQQQKQPAGRQGGRGGRDDDPGFEIVPADNNPGNNNGFGAEDEGDDEGGRQPPPSQRQQRSPGGVEQGGGTGRKRRGRVQGGGGDGNDEDEGPARGGGGGGAGRAGGGKEQAGPSGRQGRAALAVALQEQRGEGAPGAGKGAKGKGPSEEGGQRGPQRPAKKAKIGTGSGDRNGDGAMGKGLGGKGWKERYGGAVRVAPGAGKSVGKNGKA